MIEQRKSMQHSRIVAGPFTFIAIMEEAGGAENMRGVPEITAL